MSYMIIDELMDFFYNYGPFVTKETILTSSFSDFAELLDYNTDYQEVGFLILAQKVLNSARHYRILVCAIEDIYQDKEGNVLWVAIIVVEDLATGERITRWGSYMEI